MAESVRISIFGDVVFRRRILAMRYRARNMRPVLEEIGEAWADIIEDQFASEGARGGRRWDKLKLSTIFQRGSAHPILVNSSDMLIEMTDPSNFRATDESVYLSLPPEIEERASAHQYGFMNSLTGTYVPARPIIQFTDLDVRYFRDKISDYLVRGDE